MPESPSTSSPVNSPFESTVVIVGVGLIGGSLAAALKQRNVAQTVIGVGRDSTRIRAAQAAGLIDEATTELAPLVDRADVIVFCTPVDRVADEVRRAAAVMNGSPTLLLTDVGSVKGPICHELARISNFIGSHPIAGSHRQGFEAANADLFEGRTCVVTPVATSEERSIQRLERFWRAVGMTTVRMPPEAHDHSLAMTSHLPHVVASSLAATLSDANRVLTGSGFRDTTRIAEGDPELWTGILMQNANFVSQGIDQILAQLTAFRVALQVKDSTTVRKLLHEGQISRQLLDQMQQRKID